MLGKSNRHGKTTYVSARRRSGRETALTKGSDPCVRNLKIELFRYLRFFGLLNWPRGERRYINVCVSADRGGSQLFFVQIHFA